MEGMGYTMLKGPGDNTRYVMLHECSTPMSGTEEENMHVCFFLLGA